MVFGRLGYFILFFSIYYFLLVIEEEGRVGGRLVFGIFFGGLVEGFGKVRVLGFE